MLCRQCLRAATAALSGARSLSLHAARRVASAQPSHWCHRNAVPILPVRRFASAGAASQPDAGDGGEERHQFQAETKMLLDIVAKSLYSRKEVFVRELISNASDALEKLRYRQTTDSEALPAQIRSTQLEIKISCDQDKNTFIIEDNGLGMTKEDMISNLGTIARSGSKAFLEELSKSADAAASGVSNDGTAESVIGRFGVGFYSTFMVADTVHVYSRSALDPLRQVFKWTSDGSGYYDISLASDKAEDFPESGTRIVVHLAEPENQYADKAVVERIIKEHSYFIPAPVYVNGARANATEALWRRAPNKCTQDDYESFFRLITHTTAERPRYTLHYRTDSPLSINALLFVPEQQSYMQLMDPNAEIGVELYSSKLQQVLTNKIIRFLEDEMTKDRKKYQEFFDTYGFYLKEGIMSQVESSNNEDIGRLLLFESSNSRPGVKVSLNEYVQRMQASQESIYYLNVPSREAAQHSPFYEAFRPTNMEVLFVTEQEDEMTLFHLKNFSDKPIVSAENWFKAQTTTTTTQEETEYKELVKWAEKMLGPKRVDRVRLSRQRIEQPCLVTTAEHESVLRTFSRHPDFARKVNEDAKIMLMRPCLEINPGHSLIRRLNRMRRMEPDLAEMLVTQLWTNAMIQAGLIIDSRKSVGHLNDLLTKLMEHTSTDSGIIIPK